MSDFAHCHLELQRIRRAQESTDCSRAVDSYLELLARFQADIVVLQEVPRPGVESSHIYWRGQMLGRGIAVILNPAMFPSPTFVDATRSSLLVDVGGPNGFLVLGVWSCPEKKGLRQYVLETRALLEHHAELMDGRSVVIAGDLNSSPRLNTGRTATHAALNAAIESEHSVKSGYHAHRSVPQGEETDATFYLYRHENRAFHIDYCFVPVDWRVIQVEVGTHEEWSPHSDHCPVVVDIES